VRLLNILKLLLNLGYSVIFFPDNGYPEQPYTSVLQQLGIEVIYGTPQRYNLEEKFNQIFTSDRWSLVVSSRIVR
jgi:hypothetical protein